MYGAIALLAAIENIFPPVPADTAVALGTFLGERGAPVSPLGIYLATLVANTTTAIGVFLLAGRYGRGFLTSPTGQRLLAPDSRRAIERAWERHHLWGLFLGRFLPGYRAALPPFVAMMGIPAWRALPPIILASALWYGLIVLVATQLGANWDVVMHRLGSFGVVLLVIAAVATVALGALWLRHRRRLRAGARPAGTRP